MGEKTIKGTNRIGYLRTMAGQHVCPRPVPDWQHQSLLSSFSTHEGHPVPWAHIWVPVAGLSCASVVPAIRASAGVYVKV